MKLCAKDSRSFPMAQPPLPSIPSTHHPLSHDRSLHLLRLSAFFFSLFLMGLFFYLAQRPEPYLSHFLVLSLLLIFLRLMLMQLLTALSFLCFFLSSAYPRDQSYSPSFSLNFIIFELLTETHDPSPSALQLLLSHH